MWKPTLALQTTLSRKDLQPILVVLDTRIKGLKPHSVNTFGPLRIVESPIQYNGRSSEKATLIPQQVNHAICV